MNKKPIHAPLTQFPVTDNRLIVGGMRLEQILEQTGGTPFYAYDKHAIQQRVRQLRAQLPRNIDLHYAIKANPFPPVVNLLASLVDGLDIASAGELELALDSGILPTNISFAGPGKTDEELRAAVTAGITLNVESANELQRIAALGNASGIRPRVALRVNPDFDLKSSGMKMGGGARPFGMDSERIPEVLDQLKTMHLDFRGLHIFGGSQNLHPERLIEAQNATFELAYRIARQADINLHTLNIGGGFGIPYFPGELPLDIRPIMQNLHQHATNCRKQLGPVKIILELGRYLVGEAGVYVCKIIDKKVSRGKTYLIVDGGLHHHLAASGNFGQVIRKNYPVLNPERVADGPRETVTVAGPLCTPLDILADNMEIGVAEVGDYIAVLQSGAYGFSASPLGFLSHPPPAQCLVGLAE
jgi:diaminopimelate decarboxylase